MEYVLKTTQNKEIMFIYKYKAEAEKKLKEYNKLGVTLVMESRPNQSKDYNKIVQWIVEQELEDKKILAYMGLANPLKYKVDYSIESLTIGEDTYNGKDIRIVSLENNTLRIQCLEVDKWYQLQAYDYIEYLKQPIAEL